MTMEQRVKALEKKLAAMEVMLGQLLNQSAAPEIRARRIILRDDEDVCHAELRMDGIGVVLALCSEDGDEVRIELRVGMEDAPIMILSGDKDKEWVRLGEQWEPGGMGLTVRDEAGEFRWPPLPECG